MLLHHQGRTEDKSVYCSTDNILIDWFLQDSSKYVKFNMDYIRCWIWIVFRQFSYQIMLLMCKQLTESILVLPMCWFLHLCYWKFILFANKFINQSKLIHNWSSFGKSMRQHYNCYVTFHIRIISAIFDDDQILKFFKTKLCERLLYWLLTPFEKNCFEHASKKRKMYY